MSCRCAGCGHLGLRPAKGGELVEADESFRKSGELPTENNRYIYQTGPVCSKGVPICSDMKDNGTSDRLAVIHQERECDKFMTWQPGYSPKEHDQMRLVAELEERDRRRREEEQAWQKEVEERIERRHVEAERATERRHKTNLVLQFLLAILAAVVALIGAKLLPWFDL